ncbi:hypothetical protein [Tsukamurella tyrosinosolvens]|uniref:hypothetical protein n=1 Tax=Tsukamurella tyrosinosolvens TaxID=57704 RepID=UPI002DD45198|nr:hypothetical protein [Tsukamurella tyrosinosolvens]MEC4616188.1 hypothetical protein [Tsukamurella tyrosinosolvens]
MNRDLTFAGLAFGELSLRQLLDIIDYPPEGTALRDAIDGPRSLGSIHTAQIVHALNVLIWNTRGIAMGEAFDEPYPQLVLPGADVPKPAVKPVADRSDDELAAMFHIPA